MPDQNDRLFVVVRPHAALERPGWLQRVPASVFVVLSIIIVLTAAIAGLLLSLVLAVLFSISDGGPTTAFALLGALGAAVVTGVLLRRARKKRLLMAAPPNGVAPLPRSPQAPIARPRSFSGRVWLVVWALLALNVLGGLVVTLYRAATTEDPLRLELINAGMVVVTNVGHTPIEIQKVGINDRPDCGPRVGLLGVGEFQRTTLNVGDQQIWTSSCRVVRVFVRTNKGSDTYSFD